MVAIRRIFIGALAALLWLTPIAFLAAASGSDIEDGTVERVDLAPEVRDSLAESAVRTVVKGLHFIETVSGLDYLRADSDSGVTLTNAEPDDGYVQVAGTINETGMHRIVLDGFPFLFEVVDPPSTGAASYATDGSGGTEADKLVSNTGDAFSTVTLSVYAPDTSGHYRYRGVELAIFAGAPGGSYTAMPEKEKRVLTNRTTVAIDLGSADDYEADKTYRLGYRVLYSFVGADGSDMIAGDADNGKEGWRLLAENGTSFSFSRSSTPALSSDATLRGLAISEGSLSPAFSADRKSYSVTVSQSVYGVTVSPTASSGKATITVDGNVTASGAAADVSLNAGSSATFIPIIVTAEDGTTNTYTIMVARSTTDTGSVDQEKTPSPLPSDIAVMNHETGSDRLTVSNVAARANVHVYDSPSGGNRIGTATQGGMPGSLTVDVAEGIAGSFIYVTVTDVAALRAESDRVQIAVPRLVVKIELASAIASAQSKANSAAEGSANGNYKVGSKAELQAAIDAASAVRDDIISTQAQVDAAVMALGEAVAAFDAKRIVIVDNGSNVSAGSDPAPGPKTTNNSDVDLQVTVDPQQGGSGEKKGVVKLDVPAGAVPKDGKISVAIVAADQVPSTGELEAVSRVIEFVSSTGHTFDKPVEITFHYETDKVGAGRKAAVYYYNEQQHRWIYLGGTVNADGTVTVSVQHFTKFAVFENEPASFADMAGHWATTYTDRLVGMKAIQGYPDQTFRPEAAVTRAQFAKMLAEALGLQAPASVTDFADDSEIPAWSQSAVAAAVKAGLVTGYPEQGAMRFKADQTISRAEMAVMIARALSANKNVSDGETNRFKDAATIPQWAQASVEAAVSAGIVNGYADGTFRPDEKATRAEAAAMIYKLLEVLNI